MVYYNDLWRWKQTESKGLFGGGVMFSDNKRLFLLFSHFEILFGNSLPPLAVCRETHDVHFLKADTTYNIGENHYDKKLSAKINKLKVKLLISIIWQNYYRMTLHTLERALT